VRATLAFLREHAPRAMAERRVARPRFSLFHGAIGRGYGEPTAESIAAIPEVERLIGVPGEVTYSAKGLVGLREVARAHPDETILYWQTLSSRCPPLPEPASAPPGFERCFACDVAS
ncbi:MAG TPA: hypothetical protein VHB21_19820, partial [Minicystis sp.]|nr:hypothetical protein [Minicystis sp.]